MSTGDWELGYYEQQQHREYEGNKNSDCSGNRKLQKIVKKAKDVLLCFTYVETGNL